MTLDGRLGVGFLIGRVTPIAADQPLRYRRQGLPSLVTDDEAGLQVLAYIGVMGDRVSVWLVGVFVTQAGLIMAA